MRLVVLLALIISGTILGSVIFAGVMLASGASLGDLMKNGGMPDGDPMLIRFLLMINHATMFLLPAVIWTMIYYKKQWLTYLQAHFNTRWLYVIAGIAFLMVAYPLVAKSSEWNQAFNLPSWMNDMENQTADLLKKILTMNTIGALVVNLIVIAIIPGIGEELIFRGIIQKELQSYLKNPYLAIVCAATIFSALHLQFAGFLPRFMLGMILGLIYYWTGNLWISIAVHTFNNGLQVMLTYMDPTMADQDLESAVPVKWYALAGSLILTFLIGYWFVEQFKSNQLKAISPAPAVTDHLSELPVSNSPLSDE
jgi:membrane protease YdiL (CAAX protease family)